MIAKNNYLYKSDLERILRDGTDMGYDWGSPKDSNISTSYPGYLVDLIMDHNQKAWALAGYSSWGFVGRDDGRYLFSGKKQLNA